MPAFKKGISGNPQGRPKQITHESSVKELLHTHAPALIKKAISLALKGDKMALKLCLERVVPKVEPVSGLPPLPPIEAWQSPGAEITKRYRAVINGMLTGEISGKAGGELLSALSTSGEDLVDRCNRFSGKSQTREEMVDYFTRLIRTYAGTEQLKNTIDLLQTELANPNSRAKSWDECPEQPELTPAAAPPALSATSTLQPQKSVSTMGATHAVARCHQPVALISQSC